MDPTVLACRQEYKDIALNNKWALHVIDTDKRFNIYLNHQQVTVLSHTVVLFGLTINHRSYIHIWFNRLTSFKR